MIVGLEGLGSGQQAGNIALSIGSSAASAGTAAIAGATGLTTAVGASLAIPIIGAGIAGITLAIGLFLNRKGPKQKVISSKIVDEEEKLLKQNLAMWESSDKYASEREQCLNNFLAIWGETKAKLSDPSLGEPGARGIRDRDRGGKWDWWGYYYDPITNDPQTRPDPTMGSNIQASASDIIQNIEGGVSSLGISPLTLLLIAGLGLVGMGMMSNGGGR